MKPTTRDMSDSHENFLAQIFEGRKSRGSGNQFNDQMDGRNRFHETAFPLAWDGKSTLGKSVGVTMEMWEKAVEQAGAEIPVLALRFYTNDRLTAVGADLVTLSIHDFVEILDSARKHQATKTVYNRIGQLDNDVIDTLIDEWEDGDGLDVGLHAYLGMTSREFAGWVVKSSLIPERLKKPELAQQVEGEDEPRPPSVDDWWVNPGEQD